MEKNYLDCDGIRTKNNMSPPPHHSYLGDIKTVNHLQAMFVWLILETRFLKNIIIYNVLCESTGLRTESPLKLKELQATVQNEENMHESLHFYFSFLSS